MILNHPNVAFRSCDDCQKWLYDEKTGKVKTRRSRSKGNRGNFENIRRVDGQGNPVSPPCSNCPKKSPAKAHLYELSNRNVKTVKLYYRIKATSGRCLSDYESRDPILGENMATVLQILENHESNRQSEILLTALTGGKI